MSRLTPNHAPVPSLVCVSLFKQEHTLQFSHLPKPLLAETKAFFETRNLLPSQIEARDNFIYMFRLNHDSTYTDQITPEELAEHLDAFFFFAGLLTRGGILQCLEL
ncbi:hypothetical protein Daus18300_000734 [Diaporthe australafricana]|uniref:Uncharacterized protein n=1 Tax=Diaporthe australafricana TaxID=127596 RepID=A0ABR3Y1T1_9PEZI